MKKNKMMRLASFLLVAVLASTSAVSGTYAKYVTSGSAQDNARVAKFGVTVEGVSEAANQMFAQEYAADDEDYKLGAVTVAATENVVAPGTEGMMSKFTIKGQPEVAVRVSYKVDTIELKNWTYKDASDADVAYCPIEFTIKRTAGASGTTNTEIFKATEGDVDGLETAIKNYIEGATVDYAPNADLNQSADALEISWKWAFEGNDDVADTALGDKAAANTADAGKIDLKITATVTQID